MTNTLKASREFYLTHARPAVRVCDVCKATGSWITHKCDDCALDGCGHVAHEDH